MSNHPIHEVRLGYVKCAIFANETEHGIRHNVKVSRLWKDGDKWAISARAPLRKTGQRSRLWLYQDA